MKQFDLLAASVFAVPAAISGDPYGVIVSLIFSGLGLVLGIVRLVRDIVKDVKAGKAPEDIAKDHAVEAAALIEGAAALSNAVKEEVNKNE